MGKIKLYASLPTGGGSILADCKSEAEAWARAGYWLRGTGVKQSASVFLNDQFAGEIYAQEPGVLTVSQKEFVCSASGNDHFAHKEPVEPTAPVARPTGPYCFKFEVEYDGRVYEIHGDGLASFISALGNSKPIEVVS